VVLTVKKVVRAPIFLHLLRNFEMERYTEEKHEIKSALDLQEIYEFDLQLFCCISFFFQSYGSFKKLERAIHFLLLIPSLIADFLRGSDKSPNCAGAAQRRTHGLERALHRQPEHQPLRLASTTKAMTFRAQRGDGF